jgi:hypothetical protein
MTERTKYILLIIKTYLKTQNSLASEPTEPLIKDLQAELFKHQLLKKQKYIEQKTNITKEEFLLKCELAAIDLKEYGYMQYSIAVNTLKYEDLIPDQSESKEDQLKFIDKQIKFYLVDLSGLDPSIKYALYNFEIEFLKEIFENINQSSFQSTQIEKIEPNTLSSNIVNERIVYIPEQYGDVFCNDGFELFEHILSEYIKPKNTNGRYEDLSYFYRCLFDDNFIHQKPEPFRIWFMKKYTEEFSKIKTKEQTRSYLRKKNYALALDWFKSKNK